MSAVIEMETSGTEDVVEYQQTPVRQGWKQTGWHGITLVTPGLWNMVAYGGEYSAGNVRLDNTGDSSSDIVGVEIRWTSSKTAPKSTDLAKRVDQYLQAVEKEARKSKTKCDLKSKPVSNDPHVERQNVQSFTWKSDRRGHGRVWYCSECKRILIAQVVSTARHDISGLAQDILSSIECHHVNPAWGAWSLYDLFTEVPADYSLKRQPQLMNIYVQLNFEQANSQNNVSVEQWAAADLQLRGHYMDQWFKAKSGNALDGLKYQIVEGSANGHASICVTGKRTGVWYWLSVGLPQLAKFHLPTVHYSASLWECPDTNKVYLIQSNSRKKDDAIVKNIVERTRCH